MPHAGSPSRHAEPPLDPCTRKSNILTAPGSTAPPPPHLRSHAPFAARKTCLTAFPATAPPATKQVGVACRRSPRTISSSTKGFHPRNTRLFRPPRATIPLAAGKNRSARGIFPPPPHNSNYRPAVTLHRHVRRLFHIQATQRPDEMGLPPAETACGRQRFQFIRIVERFLEGVQPKQGQPNGPEAAPGLLDNLRRHLAHQIENVRLSAPA